MVLRHSLLIIASALLTALAGPAFAEREDRDKAMEIAAKELGWDTISGVKTLAGNVIITQGTLRITADRGEAREGQDGNVSGVVTGSPVLVRQKREGCDAFIESQAERVEFDQSSDTLKLMKRAKIKSGDDELTGDVILYNKVTEVFQAQGGPSKSADGLVRMVIQPKGSAKDPCVKRTATLAPGK